MGRHVSTLPKVNHRCSRPSLSIFHDANFRLPYRVLSPRFADGLTAPRISVTSHDLPLSRIVSRTMHPDEGYHDHAGTVMVIAWGQFMDHDYTLTGTPLGTITNAIIV